ncbi:MAG TPA: hypothetical protein VLC28_15595, partial [Flavitalea sp.]|nr:hypothetical protein [Flavitalea sp.]
KVKNKFTSTYSGASSVNWEKTADYYKATFWMNGKEWYAIYSKEGQEIALVHNLLTTALPGQLKGSLNNNFPDYWITDLIEFKSKGETKYFVTIDDANEKQFLESIGTIEWALVKKTSK